MFERELFVACVCQLLLVSLQPFQPSLVWEVLNRKMLKFCLETISVWTGGHQADHYRRVVCKWGISCHHVVLVVQRIIDFYGIESSDCLDPDKRGCFIQRAYAPVALLVGHNGTDIELAVHKFYPSLDVVFLVDPYHKAHLVEPDLIVPCKFYLSLKFTAISSVVKRGIIYRKSIMGYAPVITFWGHLHQKGVANDLPFLGLVEPVHFFKGLRPKAVCGQQEANGY